MGPRFRSLLIYAAKCVSGTLIVFWLSGLLQFEAMDWCLISVLLVLSPDGKDSVSLAFTRIKANLLGAGMGLMCLLMYPSNVWVVSLALALTLALCYAFKLDAGARSAMAATIIVMLHNDSNHVLETATDRVIAVVAGCVLGLLITFVFHFKSRAAERIQGKGEEA